MTSLFPICVEFTEKSFFYQISGHKYTAVGRYKMEKN